MLREARQARGLHVAALAASIKVTQRKLEALEGDRYDELPDMTFTRALAKTVCRSLKIDPGPVLALLPALGERGLDGVHQGLNTSYRDRSGRREAPDLGLLKRPMFWVPVLVLVAAGLLMMVPSGWLPTLGAGAPAASAVSALPQAAPASLPEAASAPEAAAAPPSTAPAEPVAALAGAAASAAAPAELGSIIELRVTAESWVEVLDAGGAALLQRSLQAGEVVGLDGTPPFRVKIGNAAATQLKYRGQPVDLVAAGRDNVARLELR